MLFPFAGGDRWKEIFAFWIHNTQRGNEMAEGKITTDMKGLFAACADNAVAHALPSYRRYLIKTLKSSQPYALYARARTVFRPTLWIARALRILRRAFLIIETSALLLFAAACLLLILPPVLLVGLAVFHAALRERRRMNRRLASRISGCHVTIFFAGNASVSLLPWQGTVLCVTDVLPMRHPAAVACMTANGVLYVREHYFFYLRRTLLPFAKRVAVVF